jgi:uncharacterized protein YndB with AHSA1/START domain
MTKPSAQSASTEVTRRIQAARHAIYQALVDADSLAAWLPPDGMRGKIHDFEPRAGGRIRMTLTYEDPTTGGAGKTTDDADTFKGRFVALEPDRRVVWAVEFESRQPGMGGQMLVTWELADADGATDVTVRCENIPSGIPPGDNEAGSRSSLAKLAALVE